MEHIDKTRITELRKELSRRGVYWDLRWGVEELSEWLKVKTQASGPRSHCELSFRFESFVLKISPDSLVPFRRLHLRLVAGSKVLTEIPVEDISDNFPPLHRCEIPANSRQNAMEGVTLSLHVVCKDRGHRETLGSLEVKVGNFVNSTELVVRDLTDWGVEYEVKLSSQCLSFTNRKLRKYVTFVVAALRISRLSGLRKAMADAEVKREIRKLEDELEFLLAENERMKKRLDVELAVENNRKKDFYFSPSLLNRELPAAVPPANFLPSFFKPQSSLPPVSVPAPPVAAPAPISRPPDPPVTRNVQLKLRSSDKIVIAENPRQTPPEPPVHRARESENVVVLENGTLEGSRASRQTSEHVEQDSATPGAVEKLQGWYKDLTAEKAPQVTQSAPIVPVVSKKAAKIDKILDIALNEISSIVVAKETSWLSSIASGKEIVLLKLELRVLKGTRAIDVAMSPTYQLQGTRVRVKPEESKVSLNYIGAELEDQLISVTFMIDDVVAAVGGMRLSEIIDEEVTIALSSTGAKLESDPLLTLSRYQQPKAPEQPVAEKTKGTEPSIAENAPGQNQNPPTISPPAASPKAPVEKAPVPKAKVVVPTDPKQRAIFIAQQREALVKAKQEIIAKQKQQAIEEQRFVINKAKEIAILKKAMPPPDSFKFPGMPGPPPFKPKTKPPEPAPTQPPTEGAPSESKI